MDKSIFSGDYALFLVLLSQARKDAGITQAKLAERLGETQSFVSKCERGERRLDIVEARLFCVALGLEFPAFTAQLERLIADGSEHQNVNVKKTYQLARKSSLQEEC